MLCYPGYPAVSFFSDWATLERIAAGCFVRPSQNCSSCPSEPSPAWRDVSMIDRPLSEDQRKEVFLALVDAQDHDMGVIQSRQHVAARYGVSEGQVDATTRPLRFPTESIN